MLLILCNSLLIHTYIYKKNLKDKNSSKYPKIIGHDQSNNIDAHVIGTAPNYLSREISSSVPGIVRADLGWI